MLRDIVPNPNYNNLKNLQKKYYNHIENHSKDIASIKSNIKKLELKDNFLSNSS